MSTGAWVVIFVLLPVIVIIADQRKRSSKGK